MKTTLQDIAKASGFSVSTVSRALRGNSHIHPDSERIILDRARELKYAHLPQKNDSKVVEEPCFAVITDFHTGEFYSAFYNGFASISANYSCRFGLHSFSENTSISDLITGILKLEEQGYQGAILFMPHLSRSSYQRIIDDIPRTFPLLSAALVHQPVMDTIAFDGYNGGYMVAEHFYRRGYRSFGLLLGPTHKPEALARANGFTDFCKLHSEMKIIWEFNGDYKIESGRPAFLEFNGLNEKPRAIFAANDDMAFGFLQAAQSAGYAIPEVVALAGYDDLRISQITQPPLTSVHTNFAKLARHAAKLLTDRLQEPVGHQGMQNLIPVSLTVRESS